MKKLALCTLSALLAIVAIAQQKQSDSLTKKESWKNIYQAASEKVFDLIHTKIDARFDYEKKRMPGKVWLTLKPHFYPQDSLILDAKGMFINRVAVVKGTAIKNLAFSYADSLNLRIKLDKTYKAGEQVMVYVNYTARPDELAYKASGSGKAKGLYFINPDGKDTTKPIQIWTECETEAVSIWVPIIDKPNQKTTDEITMTVPAKYVTLSNGLLKSSKLNKDGTRTDHWKMDLPHAPYLFFMGVGDYTIINDKYKNIPVQYYVEPKYASVAKKIFGLTPEMMGFFSRLLGVEYPWAKYAQITARDYVSGAMENTTATLHGSAAYQTNRSLADGLNWESTIAHELFHQWFGDLVTAESWSNLTLNESFANYAQTLWYEYKYGKDAAGEENYSDMQKYLRRPANSEKVLTRFYYDDKEKMFDDVSYEKGGRVLHLLRDYLGDSAFFKGLNLYLNTYKFKAAETHQLRLAMEEVSGKDLNWFFNQWYFQAGHPEVDITYEWLDSSRQQKVTIVQNQKGQLFEFPLAIDMYNGTLANRHQVWVKDTVSTFYFAAAQVPDLVNVDAKKIMLWKKNDPKTAAHYLHQFNNAPLFVDRKEALDFVAQHFDSSTTQRRLMANGLLDAYASIRQIALQFWKKNAAILTPEEEKRVYNIAQKDNDQPTRAMAIDILARRNGKPYEAFFLKSVTDSSYSVAGAALEALLRVNPTAAMAMEKELKKDAEGRLKISLNIIAYLKRDVADADSVAAEYKRMSFLEKDESLRGMFYYAYRIKDLAKFKKAIGFILEDYVNARKSFPAARLTTAEYISWLLGEKEKILAADQGNEMIAGQIKYIKEKTGMK